MAHIKDFKMKFEFKFGMNDDLMAKYFPTTFRGDALNWCFSLPSKSINFYVELILEFYMYFKYQLLYK